MRYVLYCMVFVLSLPHTLLADDDIHLVKLTISPAARPVPVMRYRLTPAARDLVPGNAAALYYRAIVTLAQNQKNLDPERAVDDRHREQIEQVLYALGGVWLDLPRQELPLDAAKEVLARWQATLNQLTLGAGRTQAIWDLPLREEGVGTLLPEMQEIRTLARLLALRARVEIVEGRFNDAAATLRTMIRMSEHVSQSGTVVSSLVAIACDGIAIGEIENWIDAPHSPNLYWALTALPNPPIDLSIGLESEHLWIEAAIPHFDLLERSILSAEQAQEVMQGVGRFMEQASDQPNIVLPGGLRLPTSSGLAQMLPMLATYPTAKRELIARGRSAAEVEQMPVAQVVVIRWVAEYRDTLDEMIAWGPQSYVEAAAALADFDEHTANMSDQPSGHFAAILLPALGAARRAEVRLQQRVAMLRVIEALRLYAASHGGGLPADLDEITEVPVPVDPVDNQPFAYKLDGSTATLRSNHADEVIFDVRYEITVR